MREKEDKLLYYCMECGYIGSKANPSSCDHKKQCQISKSTFESRLSYNHQEEKNLTGELAHQYLNKFIYDNSHFISKLYVNTVTNQLVLQLEYTKSIASKPLFSTLRMIKILADMGFKCIEFVDPYSYCSDTRLTRLYLEVLARVHNKDYLKIIEPTSIKNDNGKTWCDKNINNIEIVNVPIQTRFDLNVGIQDEDQEVQRYEKGKLDIVCTLYDKEMTNLYIIKKDNTGYLYCSEIINLL